MKPIKQLIEDANASIQALRERANEPFSLQVSDLIHIEVRPAHEGDRITVGCRDWGDTTINYTVEGLKINVYGQNDPQQSMHSVVVQPDGLAHVQASSARDQDESNALIEHINAALLRGDSPITRMAGTKHFTVDYQGAEVLFTHFMLVQFESYLREPLLVHAEGPNEVILPGSSVRARVEQEAWVTAVAAKETKESFFNWRESFISSLRLARHVYENDQLM
ncbi:MAG: hypothetical protein Q8S92_15445 [Hydrogenophaga sp.]|uniref:hypothetical protein n=1 Tax=Hydrogenophaga sp. TaxID=1904254 RepID=UPI002732B2AC|nr:hypothetical protein [Hydrogenophaga sp.]MDP3350384.1 hypothetical protein [Hydrogenophaga sp.]